MVGDLPPMANDSSLTSSELALFEDIQDRVHLYQRIRRSIEEFLCADPDKELTTPKFQVLIRLFNKEQIQTVYDINRSELDRMKSKSSAHADNAEGFIEDEIDAIKSDQKFLREILHHWKHKKKICKRMNIWSVPLRSRALLRSSLTSDEQLLYFIKLAEVRLLEHEKQREFEWEVRKQLHIVANVLKIGLSLGLWNPEEKLHAREQLEQFHKAAKRFQDVPRRDSVPNVLRQSKKFEHTYSKLLLLQKKETDLLLDPSLIDPSSMKLTVPIESLEPAVLELLIRKYQATVDELTETLQNPKKKKSKTLQKQLKVSQEQLDALQQAAAKAKPPKRKRKSVRIDSKKDLKELKSKAAPLKSTLKSIYSETVSGIKQSIEVLQKTKQQTIAQMWHANILAYFVDPVLATFYPIKLAVVFLRVESVLMLVVDEENVQSTASMWRDVIAEVMTGKNETHDNDMNSVLDQQITLAKQLALAHIDHTRFPTEHVWLEEEFKKIADPSQSLDTLSQVLEVIKKPKEREKLIDNLLLLSKKEREGLLVLTDKIDSNDCVCGPPVTTKELFILLEYLKEIKGNLDFNHRLTDICNQDSIPFGISQASIDFSRTFSFKSRHLDLLSPLTSKLESLWSKIKEGKGASIHKSQKITLKELGILRSLERWSKNLDVLFQLIPNQLENPSIANHPLYITLQAAVVSHRKLKSIIAAIQHQINIDQTYQSGDMLMAIWTRKVKTMQGNRPPRAFSVLMAFTKYEHTAVIYKNENISVGPLGEPRLSHMYREYHDSELTLEDIACADVFRLVVGALVTDKEDREKLKQHLGDKWDQVLQERYSKLEASLHSEKQTTLGGITNPMSRVMNIGTAAVMPWTRLRRTNMDFTKIHSTLYSNEERKKGDLQMTCSEFAAKSTIAALIELNEQLVKELPNVGDKTIINLPFPTKEKFKTMQPDRLRQLITDRHALSEVHLPAFIANLIKL